METRINKNGKISYRDMITIEGKTFKSPWCHRKTDCQGWKALKKSERHHLKVYGPKPVQQERIKFMDYASQWLIRKIKPHKAQGTYQTYESLVRTHYNPVIGLKYLDEITHKDAEDIILKMKEDGSNNAGINHVTGKLKQILNYAVEENILVKNPLAYCRPLKCTDEGAWDYWNELEINKFFTGIRDLPHFSLFATAIYTGLRRGELAGLKWDCVDLEGKRIRVQAIRDRYDFRKTTKTGKFRSVSINASLYPILAELKSKKTDHSDFVFLDENSEPVDSHHMNRIFDRYQRKVPGLKKVRLHDLRHTFASHFVMNGGSLYVLKELLGHSSVEMTQRYAHLSPEHMQGVTNILSFDGIQSRVNPNLTHEGLRLVSTI